MLTLDLKPTHKVIQNYYRTLQEISALAPSPQNAMAPAFANLLRYCAKQVGLRLVEQEYVCKSQGGIGVDGVLLDDLQLRHGIWETKDSQEELDPHIHTLFQQGCPNDNILFQSPGRLIIYQDQSKPVFDKPIGNSPKNLVAGLKLFLEYQKPEVKEWRTAAVEFQGKIAELGQELVSIIQRERKTNLRFQAAFNRFTKLCQQAINPNLARAAIEEMLVQHLLTEKLFSRVFNNPEFISKNAIAQEIEQVVNTLTSQSFGKSEFLKRHPLERFYTVLDRVATTIEDHADKQLFLKAVYERFFQGFAVKVADTHGIAYTPPSMVEFIVKAVSVLLQREFGSSLADKEVHLIDPFVGTGSFIVRVLQEIYAIQPSRLKDKYLHELHCNEVMLLLYYIACLNIEHEFYRKTGKYQKFDGIRLVDTFEQVEDATVNSPVPKTSTRGTRNKETSILVIMGNPPYNVGQQNENDNNKNRKYPKLDKLVANSYAKDSKATSVSKLNDPYVKAFRWAAWQLRDRPKGIVALITNNGFLDNLAFDGMRKHLTEDFNQIYCLDLGGNIRKMPGVQNVFDIRVGVSITLLVKNPTSEKGIFYAHVGDHLKKQEKLEELTRHPFAEIHWQQLQPDANHTWLTNGLQPEFVNFVPLGSKAIKTSKVLSKGVLFKTFSLGVNSNRDSWVYHFAKPGVVENVKRFLICYNTEVDRWLNRSNKPVKLDDFVLHDPTRVKWSSRLKEYLSRGHKTKFSAAKIRRALYRPFTTRFFYFDEVLIHRLGRFPIIFPTPATEAENQAICVSAAGNTKTFHCLMVKMIADLHLTGDSQCFPFYTYNEDGSGRQENITDWALSLFQTHYQDTTIAKWDIFYYVYGLLHHPTYRQKYAANLKRELPRIPPSPYFPATPKGRQKETFWAFSQSGKQLSQLHLYYEQQPEYPLLRIATTDTTLSYRVEKMRLTKPKDNLIYNDTLTLAGIPPAALEYRLGSRSALEWLVDQYQVTINGHRGSRKKLEWLNDYQVKTAAGSGIVNNPNRADDEEYILRLIGQVIRVSVETMKIVKELPDLE